MCKLLVLVLAVAAVAHAETAEVGHGLQILGKIVRQYLNSQPEDVKLSQGVHLVNVRSDNDARAATDDKSTLGAVENYLQTHELRIRLPELMPGDGFGRAFKDALDNIEGNDAGSPRGGGGGGGGGKKGDGGMGGVMIMGLMMGKMMAALGLGGVGLLAMKALMVSALALMLSLVIGLKKLVGGGGHDEGHTVIHASHGGGGGHHEYRKKREAADIAYQAWRTYNSS